MANKILGSGMLSLLAGAILAGPAMAGGFTRGEADTDILYEDGTAAFRSGLIYVSPHRSFNTVRGAAGTDGRYSEDYWIPSIAAKARFSDMFSCAVTYTQPFGADSIYGTQAQNADRAADLANPSYAFRASGQGNAVKSAGFDSDEYGATCAVNSAIGPGNAYLIGGVFVQTFDYTEVKDFGTLNLRDDSGLGYRIGAAYEIKEYALRGELMYRSEVEHDASGTFVNASPVLQGALGIPVGATRSSTGSGKMPQSVELSLQSGIAPDWLAFGSVKWTDWSVLQYLSYTVTGIPGEQRKDFFWRDGWTVQAGIGHKFTDDISGAVNLTWDRGVGQGADIMSDTWTVGAGTQIKAGPGSLRFGGAVSYLTGGEQKVSQGASLDATADGDWAYALSGSYIIKF